MAANLARPLELDLLCRKLDTDYAALIVGTGTDDNAKRSNFLSKAVAAFVLHEAAGASIADAVAASIDGGTDHGIDSVFIAADHTIWLVQSKYIDSGAGEPVLGDVSKFRDGVADLLHGKMERFNDALQNRQAALTNALNNEICKIEVVLAHTGGAIHDDRRHIFGDLERGFNGTNPGFVRCRAFGLATLHDLHLDGASAEPIDAEVELKDFGYANMPYRAFYGRMNVKRLVELWNDHQEQLVDRNIRRFKGATTVNAGLSKTLKTEAEHFFYFNNGVTFLCKSIKQLYPFDSTRQLQKFDVRGMSIINGAQTVGAIAQEATVSDSLWITIDDNEAHYLKVLCDEVFGRSNFVSNAIWQKKYAPANDALWLSDSHDHILVYAKSKEIWRPNKLARTAEQDLLYKNPDDDPRGPWMSDNYTCAKTADERPNLFYSVVNPNTGEEIWPKRTRVWAFDQSTHQRHMAEKMIYWGKDGKNSTPRLKKFLSKLRAPGRVATTIWLHDEVGHNQDANREQQALNASDPFKTPKPERLIERVINLASNLGDLVLDSFAGSGTTGAVAHKMGRRWIMVELGEHCHTHIIPRLKKVIDGEDKGGVSESAGWSGGGGFRYYSLAPSLIVNDRWGNPVINPEYNATQLAEALAKLEGFSYAPSEVRWWQHGHSSERDFIYVTTQNLSADQLQALSDEVGSEQSLLVCCSAFRGVTTAQASQRWPNLTLKKIPKMVLARCEWGHDDYSLNVANLPMAQEDKTESTAISAKTKGKKATPANPDQGGLFEQNAGENK